MLHCSCLDFLTVSIMSLLTLCYTVHAFLFLIFGLGIYRRVTSVCLLRFILMRPECVQLSNTATEGITLHSELLIISQKTSAKGCIAEQ